MSKLIISNLELFGMLSGGHLGFKHGNNLKNKIVTNYPSLTPYYSYYVKSRFSDNKILDETLFFNIVGGLAGVCISHYMYGWIIFLPITAMSIIESEKFPFKSVREKQTGIVEWFKSFSPSKKE
jgi:hypothetical protein